MTSAETVARLEQVLSLNPNTEELTLDAQGIENLLTLMPLLSQFTNLRRLRLARNRLRGLPEDLSALHNLELLDVSSNPIQGLGSVIRGLYGLTNLKHLYIDLPLESDEDEIIVALTSLESFNGTPLTENAVLPPPPSSVSASAPLNTSHGTRKFVTSTVSSEVTPSPPNLGTASSVSNFSKSQQANSGVAGVKMLLSRYPVGSPVGFPSNNTHAHTYRKWSESDKAQVQRFYYAAQAIHGERIAQRSEFDEYTAHVVGHLQSVLSAEEDPFRRGVEILRAKKTIFGYCFEEIVRGAAKFNAELSKSLQVVHDTYSHLIEEADILFKDAFADRDARIASLHGDMGHAVREIETLMLQLEEGGGNRQGSVSPYLDANERQRLVEEIGWLRAENERLTVRLRQHEFARPSLSVQSVGSLQGGNGPARAHSDTMSTSQARRFGNAPDGSSLHGIQHHPTTTNSYGGMQSGPAISVGKSLTLRQLKEVIEDIYTSKSKFDIKCLETHLPRETMEQHMYTYLNQKYGLKHLILDWATAIIQGVRKYASEDNDVAVFGHILRNEIDEEFRFVQRQLKDTVHELLRVYLKGKYPLKNDEEIGKMLKRRVGSSVREEEWIDIVKYMYNAEDSVSIILRIKEVIRLYHYPRSAVRSQQRSASNYRSGSHAIDASGAPTGGTRGQRNTDSQPPNDIPYTEFLKILLDFQLEGHQRFLSSFVKAFRHVDTDRNGILNEFEFRALLNVMDPNKTEDEVTALLDMIDPHNNQLINFSECVTFLSSELVRLVQAQEGDGVCSNIASGGHAPFQRPV